jgi:hypothetical protein
MSTKSYRGGNMGYKTDGSSHRNGVANEGNVVKILNNNRYAAEKLFPVLEGKTFKAQKKGGTKVKEDMIITSANLDKPLKVSIKRKQGAKTGSFDWVNASKAYTDNKEMFPHIHDVAKEVESIRELSSIGDREIHKERIRKEYKEASSRELDGLTEATSFLRDFLWEHFIKAYSDIDGVTVTDKKTGLLHKFDFMDHPAVRLLQKGYEPYLVSKDKKVATSRSIIFRKEGLEDEDHGLRIRLVTNNGIGAWLGCNEGRKNKNQNSRPVFKIQQDAVHKLLESTNAIVVKTGA